MTEIVEIKKEIDLQVSNENTLKTLLSTTFKGLAVENVKPAILEGRLRGFTFEDFLQKNIYAIPYGRTYSLVTSIDYARKVGMRSGIVGKSAPSFEVDEKGQIISCSITVKRSVGGTIGDFTATAYFSEYSTGKNLWVSKPRTMIAKVAEMHALRMACPEELAQAYVEEERESEATHIHVIDLTVYETKLKEAKTLEDVKRIWLGIPVEAKTHLTELKEELKKKYENT